MLIKSKSKLITTLVCLLLVTLAIFCVNSVRADAEEVSQTGQCGESLTWTLYADGAFVLSGKGSMPDYSSTAQPWYAYRESIKTVTVENGVDKIGAYAFNQCKNLETVTVSDSVESIGAYAFSYCSKLTDVTLGSSMKKIAGRAFYNCKTLTNVTLKGTTDWWIGAAAHSTTGTDLAAEELADPTTVALYLKTTYVERYWFRREHVHSYTATVTAPACTTAGFTTYDCRCGDTYVDDEIAALGHGYVVVGNYSPTCTEAGYTVYVCDRCGDTYTGDETATLPHNYADRYCTACGAQMPILDTGSCGEALVWTLYENGELVITGQGEMADFTVSSAPWLGYSTVITSITVEEGVTSIGENAFSRFAEITEVTLPDSLNTIGRRAFASSFVQTVVFRSVDGWRAGDTDVSVEIAEAKIAVEYLTDTYSAVAWTRNTDPVDPPAPEDPVDPPAPEEPSEDEDLIAEGSFIWKLTKKGLLKISGKGAMPNYALGDVPWEDYATLVVRVEIDEGITSVGRCAFYGCTALESVSLPSTIVSIEEYAFYSCKSLTEITIPASVGKIGAFAFRRSGITTVNFETNYGWSAGGVSFSATEIYYMGVGYLSMGYYKDVWTRDYYAESEDIDPNFAYGDMCNFNTKWILTYIDDTKTKMKLTISGNGAMPDYGTGKAPWYEYLNDIVEVEVCEGVTSIGRCAFYGLKFVKTATLHEGLTSIGDYAFSTCYSLKEILIPSTVTQIGTGAFAKTGLSETPSAETAESENGTVVRGGEFGEGATLVSNAIPSDSEEGAAALEAIADQEYDKDARVYIVDIHVTKDGAKIQPNGKVRVYVPLPDEAVKKYIVFHIRDDNTVELLTPTVIDGKLSFEVESFSRFVFIPDECIHVFGAPVHIDSATCLETGRVSRKCTLCGYAESTTERGSHKYGELVAGKEPTYYTAGTVAHYKCFVCRGIFNEAKESITTTVLPKLTPEFTLWLDGVLAGEFTVSAETSSKITLTLSGVSVTEGQTAQLRNKDGSVVYGYTVVGINLDSAGTLWGNVDPVSKTIRTSSTSNFTVILNNGGENELKADGYVNSGVIIEITSVDTRYEPVYFPMQKVDYLGDSEAQAYVFGLLGTDKTTSFRIIDLDNGKVYDYDDISESLSWDTRSYSRGADGEIKFSKDITDWWIAFDIDGDKKITLRRFNLPSSLTPTLIFESGDAPTLEKIDLVPGSEEYARYSWPLTNGVFDRTDVWNVDLDNLSVYRAVVYVDGSVSFYIKAGTTTVKLSTKYLSEVILNGGALEKSGDYIKFSGEGYYIIEYLPFCNVINFYPVPHEHTYEAVITAPTCTSEGYTTYTCACGDSYVGDTVAALPHSYKAVVTAPTCTAEGFTAFTCRACGDTYVGDITATAEHEYGELIEGKEPTFFYEGAIAHYICGVCGGFFNEEKQSVTSTVIPMLTADLTLWLDEVPAGEFTVTSSTSAEIKLSLNDITVTAGQTVTLRRTGSSEILYEFTVSENNLDSAGIVWGNVDPVSKTIRSASVSDFTVILNKTGNNQLKANGYMNSGIVIEITSVDTGYEPAFFPMQKVDYLVNPETQAYVFGLLGTDSTTSIRILDLDNGKVYDYDDLSETWDTWSYSRGENDEIQFSATITDWWIAFDIDGDKKITLRRFNLPRTGTPEIVFSSGDTQAMEKNELTVGSDEYSRYVWPLTNGVFSRTSFWNGTIESNGVSVYRATFTIDSPTRFYIKVNDTKLGVDYLSEVEIANGAFGASGSYIELKHSGEYIIEYLPFCNVINIYQVVDKGHSYEKIVTLPTCTEDGYTTYVCACGNSYVSDTVAATGHSYNESVIAPTCIADGYTAYTCGDCGDRYVDNVTTAPGHSYTESVTAPTCTNGGYTTYTCGRCGNRYVDNETAALGHSYEDGICSVCGKHESDSRIIDRIDVLGITMPYTGKKPATDDEPYVLQEGLELLSVEWVKEDENNYGSYLPFGADDYFEYENSRYIVKVRVQLKSGYQFSCDPDYGYFDGYATVNYVLCWDINIHGNVMEYYTYLGCNDTTIYYTGIAGVTEPVAGEHPDFDFITVYDGYHITEIRWIDESEGDGTPGSGRILTEDDVFIEDHYYMLEIVIEVDEGYSFFVDVYGVWIWVFINNMETGASYEDLETANEKLIVSFGYYCMSPEDE